jgi:hypothetical protein
MKRVLICAAVMLLAVMGAAMASAQALNVGTMPASVAVPTDVQNFYWAGMSYNNGGSPALAGNAGYARRLVDSVSSAAQLPLYGFTSFDVVPASTKPFSVTSNVGIGIAQKIATIGKVPVWIPTAAGISWTGSNTGYHYDFGMMATIHVKGQWFLAPMVRGLKDNLNGDGFHPIIGVNIGLGQ